MENLIMKFYTEKKKKTEEISIKMSSHRMINKTNRVVYKNAQKITSEIEDLQIDLENMENEISRVK